ncbi:dCTP deaminase [Peptostreptococcus stomatis]|uniref:dCTP deaminase n=1 Tax=Peptostreptococcus stomatis TaxID=341694 RepID=UPI003FA103E9
MILTDKDIKLLLNEIDIIEPFQDEYLQSESYDLHIGETYYTMKKNTGIIDLDSQKDLDDMYCEKKFDDSGYILSPKEFILVTLKEKITLTEKITAHIRPRTRLTRSGLEVLCQHCNSTYSGILRIGLYNLQDRPVKIYKNLGLCQIVFEELKQVPSENKLYKNKTKEMAPYQNENEFIGSKKDPFFEKEVKEIIDYYLGENN